jgi:hypothetical protein
MFENWNNFNFWSIALHIEEIPNLYFYEKKKKDGEISEACSRLVSDDKFDRFWLYVGEGKTA